MPKESESEIETDTEKERERERAVAVWVWLVGVGSYGESPFANQQNLFDSCSAIRTRACVVGLSRTWQEVGISGLQSGGEKIATGERMWRQRQRERFLCGVVEGMVCV